MRASQTRSLFALAAAIGACAASASNWDPVVTVNGQSISLDRSRVGRIADGRATAWTRLALQQELIDEAGMRYTAIDAQNRYDCEKHSFATIKRVYRRDGKAVRTENVGMPREMSAEPGTPDDKLLNEICRSAVVQTLEDSGVPVVDAKATIVYADVRSAEPAAPGKPAQAADKPADAKPAEKPSDKTDAKPAERKRFIEVPTIDKSKVEDPNAGAKAAAKDEKPSKAEKPTKSAKPEKPAPVAPAAPAVPSTPDRASAASRAELERQYASSGPRRSVKPKREAEVPVVHDIHWSYQGEGGPANWGKLRPDYATCATGKRQSPIDIRDTIRVDLEPIKFDYKAANFRVTDNGHAIQVEVSEGSTIQIMERTYDLVQFHFHKPGEERINGRTFDMVVHLVHRDVAGRLAVIAVPLEKGSENPLVQAIWNNIPLDRDQEVAPSWVLDLNMLLPPPERRAYFTYMGSLTTPPCTEDVLWMVFKQPMQVSPQQIAIFSHLYMNNARPIQPSNGRLVKENR